MKQEILNIVRQDAHGSRDGFFGDARRVAGDINIDATGKFVLPGLIDGHVHLTDGTGVQTGPFPDQHLVPGRGSQPCAEVLHRLAADNYPGMVVLEVNTRSLTRDERLADLAESLAFARQHLALAAGQAARG